MSEATVPGLTSLTGKDPANYRPHPLHGEGRSYLETNCYTDIIIELLHACGYEPLAGFGHLVRMDFEGDQWTFFKPPPDDLELLFGVDIHEMQPYRPLPVQMAEQIERGRTIIVELDSWYLPDTASTSYRSEHVKTSVAADAIDRERERLRYFHSAGLFELEGEDYRGVFRIGEFSDDVLPPYTELARFDAGPPLRGEELREAAVVLLREHLSVAPRDNPFERFGAALARELPALLGRELDDYHAYAFATVRMAGSAFEVAASHARWLHGAAADPAVEAMSEIVDGCKALSFRLARRRQFDPEPLIATLASAWARALAALSDATG
ncbi:MAG TPA: DUF1839 family protein [Solirubrobacteraceae bacterium]|nr:DUF1839 family protein [Solirubrobacteraceae bacterium]